MNIQKLNRKTRRLQTHSFKRILRLCKRSEYISFDVFDTLLFRRVNSAHDIFRLMEKQLQVKDFCAKRIAANEEIRNHPKISLSTCTNTSPKQFQCQSTPREDFLLREIYDYMEGFTPEERASFAALECELEIAHCEPRPDVKEIYEECLRMGKTILLISDMYLPRDCIEGMLAKCGYEGYSALYISGEEGKLKLTGNLFRLIMERTGISARSLFHMGDNFTSDFIRPRQLHIKSAKLKALNSSEKLLYL